MARRLSPPPGLQQQIAREYLQQVLDQTGWKGTELARRIGVTASTITRFKNKPDVAYKLTIQNLYKVAEVSNIPLPPELLDAYGVAPSTVVTGDALPSPNVEQLATLVRERLLVSPAGGDQGRPSPDPQPPRRPDVDFSNVIPLGPSSGIKDLPIYAAVKGSYDGTYIDMSSAIEYQERPPYLAGSKEAFGIIVVSDSMEPRYWQGETLYVNPNHPCQPGDFVVVEIAGHQGMVKRLGRRTAEYVELEQYNPAETRRFKRQEIKAMYKVMGSKSR